MTEQFFLMYYKFFCQKESLLTYLLTSYIIKIFFSLIAEEVSTENNVTNDSNTLYVWIPLFYLLNFSCTKSIYVV